jgi:pSer/pThr/pTyr-binding forkhead associated (FHA) protein
MENFTGLFLLGLRISLAIILYLFLYWSIRIIWKNFSHTAQVASQRSIPAISLTLNSDEKFCKTFSIDEIIVGRDLSCDFQILDETVSSKHSRIYYSYNQWWVEDLGSSNGSFINEFNVSTPAVLTEGDNLRLGKIEIAIKFPNQ